MSKSQLKRLAIQREMKTVYVVTWLDYSNGSDPEVVVEGVYKSLEKAEEMAKKFFTGAVHGVGLDEEDYNE